VNVSNPSALAREFMESGRSKSCPVIDMHGHYGPFHGGYLPAADPDRLSHILTRAGVRLLVCSSHDALFVEPDEGNAEIQDAIDRYPGQILGYWTCNPNFPEQVKRAGDDVAVSHGFVGFKFLPDYHTYPVTGRNYAPALEYADEHALNVLVHTWGGSAFDSPRLIEEIAARYPNAVFIMGHSGFGEWDVALPVARDFPNVYLELTCVYFAHDFGNLPVGSGAPIGLMSHLQMNGILERMVECASSKKILHGTDMPWYSPHYAIGAVLFAKIDEEARHDILHRNAERLLARWL